LNMYFKYYHTARFFNLFFGIILTSLFAFNSNAQCTNGSSWGSTSAPTNATPITITTCAFNGDYSTVSGVAAATTYVSTITGGGCITVHQGTVGGPVVGWGTSPLSWTSTSAGTYYIHYNTSCAGCGTGSSCLTSTIACSSCSGGGSNPCTSITSIAACGTSVTANLSGTGGGWSVTACGWSTGGDEQIYSFTPTTSGVHSLNITSASGGFIDYFWVNSTAGCSSTAGWNCIAATSLTGSIGSMNWTAGQTYYILVDPEGSGSFSTTFSITCPSAGPCATPTNIIGCGASYSSTVSGTGAWATNPCFWSTPGLETLYTYTATSTGNHAINVTGITGPFAHFGYKPVSGGCSSTGWTCIDDVLFTGTTPTFPMTAGVQYYIIVERETTASSTVTFNLDCPGSAVTASDCNSYVNICSNASFQIDPNGSGAIMEIPPLGSIGNPDNINPGGSGNWGCLRSFTPELNSTWMVVNIATGGNLEFSFGAGGAQAGFYDWIMYPYNPTACAQIPTGTYAPVRCNWNWASTGGTGLASAANLPSGGDPGNYEPPLAVLTGQQYIICFSNYSSAVTSVPLNFFGTATVSCTPLPSELMNFDGVVYNKMARLDWKTFTETNTSHFIIEHSLNGIDFTEIGRKSAQGNSNIETPYNFIHSEMNLGINYYRLATIDLNEDRNYSRIIQLESKQDGFEITEIYPNPSNDLFAIKIATATDMEIEVEITDVIGKQIYFSKENITSGDNTISISSSQFSKGMYHLKITNKKNNQSLVKQIFKQD